MPANSIINIGERFTRLVVLGFHEVRKQKRFWKCLCDCGNHTIVNTNHLRANRVKSCGCLHLEVLQKNQQDLARATTHGMSRTPEYRTLLSMIQRCENPNVANYHGYGGIGVRVCEGYHVFENFFADVGEKPEPKSDYSIDRHPDNTGGYWCGKCDECAANGWAFNVRWATRKEQTNNRANTIYLTLNGRTLPLGMWAEIRRQDAYTLYNRHRLGWSDEKVLTTP